MGALFFEGFDDVVAFGAGVAEVGACDEAVAVKVFVFVGWCAVVFAKFAGWVHDVVCLGCLPCMPSFLRSCLRSRAVSPAQMPSSRRSGC